MRLGRGTLLQPQKLSLLQPQQKRAERLQSKQLSQVQGPTLSDIIKKSIGWVTHRRRSLLNNLVLWSTQDYRGEPWTFDWQESQFKFGMERSAGCVPNWFAGCREEVGLWISNRAGRGRAVMRPSRILRTWLRPHPPTLSTLRVLLGSRVSCQ